MFTALQLAGLALIVFGLVLLAGVAGGAIGAGVALVYVGVAGER